MHSAYLYFQRNIDKAKCRHVEDSLLSGVLLVGPSRGDEREGCYLRFGSICRYWTTTKHQWINTSLFKTRSHSGSPACLHFLTLTSIQWNIKQVNLAVFPPKWNQHSPTQPFCVAQKITWATLCVSHSVCFLFRVYSTEIVKAVCVLLFGFDFYTNTWKWVRSGKHLKLWKCTTLGKQTRKKIDIIKRSFSWMNKTNKLDLLTFLFFSQLK